MDEQDVCQVICIDTEKASKVSTELNKTNTLGAAKIFKALSDETRIKIAYALYLESELCVCDLATIVNSSNAVASHHLRLLKKLGLAKYRKEGKLVFYSLVDDHVRQLIHLVFEHQKELIPND